MDFISGALPNVMFITGIIAIGIALGIEFKIVEIKGQLSKHGRIVAFLVGVVLIGYSIHLYTKPNQVAAVPAAPTAMPAPAVQAQMAAVIRTPIPPTTVLPPSPVASPEAPAGEPLVVEGEIRQLGIEQNQTIVMINKAAYVLPPELVVNLGSSLQVGATLKLTGTQLTDGSVVINNVVVSSTPSQEHDEEKRKEKETED